jgi:hypothetical protein
VTTYRRVSARSPQLNHHNHRRTRLNFGLVVTWRTLARRISEYRNTGVAQRIWE